MVVLSASKLQKSFGADVLFDNVSFHVEQRDHIGLVGANGAGKTTLFQLITGQMEADGGEVHCSREAVIGYLEQHACNDPHRTVLEEALSCFAPLLSAEEKLHEIAVQLDHSADPELIDMQHRLQEQFESDGGLTFRSRTRAALLGLGFEEQDLNRPMSTLSGGQKSKVGLARLLVSGANFLLLDEPTNHLDITSVEWLEQYLQDFNGAFVVISHDRYFLDKVTRRTFELEHGRLATFDGGYSKYLEHKEEQREIQRRHYETQMREIHRIEGIVEQQRRWNRERNIKKAESELKRIDRLKEELEVPESEIETIHFRFEVPPVSGNDVLVCEDLSKSFGSKRLFDHASFTIQKGERVFLIGENGCGKTTFLKMLTGELGSDAGRMRRGAGVQIGYYDQNLSGLHPNKTVLDEIWDDYPRMTQTMVRSALAIFLFKGDDVFKPISALSGGERARVALLKLMLSKANFLLLDEPTNHLDVGSREALEGALKDYEGTLLIVSHDRYLINKLADRVLRLTIDGVEQYVGNYDAYLEKMMGVQKIAASPKPIKKPNAYQQRKEAESAKRRMAGRFKRLEAEIEQMEQQQSQVTAQLEQPDVSVDYTRIVEINAQLEEIQKNLDALYEEWETLGEQLNEA
ncbi:ribosomal protection-like ABC-F family protein [Solibaculum mannosilyticum]|uniref:ribosomal protection-like ABC-F family protein n=1 Tax=Solibaculum mannosilyticum TaxID=2780922 RepID=UPI0034C157A1